MFFNVNYCSILAVSHTDFRPSCGFLPKFAAKILLFFDICKLSVIFFADYRILAHFSLIPYRLLAH